MNIRQSHDQRVDKLILYGICGLFFLIPVATSPAVILGIVTLSIWILSGRCFKDRRWLHQKWTLPVIIFLALPWAGLLYADDVAYSADLAKKSYYWLYAFAFAGIALGNRNKKFIDFFLGGLTFSVMVAMLQLLGLVPMPKGFATGLMGGGSPYITYSLFLVVGMLFMASYFRKTDVKWKKGLIILAISLYILNLSAIPGRSGYLAFIALSPLMLYQLFSKRRLVWVAGAAIALAAFLFSSTVVRERVQLAVDEVRGYYTEGEIETSVGARLQMWDGALRIFMEHPLIGAGTGDYKSEMSKHSEFQDAPDHPHNSFLYVASSFGIVGLSVFLWILAVLLTKGWRERNTVSGFAIMAFTLVLLIGSMTDTQILSLSTGMMFALITGMSGDVVEEDNDQKRS